MPWGRQEVRCAFGTKYASESGFLHCVRALQSRGPPRRAHQAIVAKTAVTGRNYALQRFPLFLDEYFLPLGNTLKRSSRGASPSEVCDKNLLGTDLEVDRLD